MSQTVTPAKAISIYPNPTSGILHLRAGEKQPEQLTLFNVLGESVLNIPWRTELDLRALPNGIYLVKVRYADGANTAQRLELSR